MVTEEQACRENNHRRENERTEIFPSMLKNLKKLELKRINLGNKDINNHESAEVNDKSFYLVGYNGWWNIAKAKRDYWNKGWEFNIGCIDPGLGMIDFLFEIIGLEKYEEHPLGWLEYESDDEDMF